MEVTRRGGLWSALIVGAGVTLREWRPCPRDRRPLERTPGSGSARGTQRRFARAADARERIAVAPPRPILRSAGTSASGAPAAAPTTEPAVRGHTDFAQSQHNGHSDQAQQHRALRAQLAAQPPLTNSATDRTMLFRSSSGLVNVKPNNNDQAFVLSTASCVITNERRASLPRCPPSVLFWSRSVVVVTHEIDRLRLIAQVFRLKPRIDTLRHANRAVTEVLGNLRHRTSGRDHVNGCRVTKDMG